MMKRLCMPALSFLPRVMAGCQQQMWESAATAGRANEAISLELHAKNFRAKRS